MIWTRINKGETLASVMIEAAVDALSSPEGAADLHLYSAGPINQLITGVSSNKTAKCRSRGSLPGQCYLHAGWEKLDKAGGKADVWLCRPWENPFHQLQPPTAQLPLF